MSFDHLPEELINIISDNTSGSRELLDKILHYLRNNHDKINPKLISSLQKHFHDFQTIQNFLANLGAAYQENSIKEFLNKYNNDILFHNIYRSFKPLISDLYSFITISNSKTILEILKLTASEKESIEVIVSEGRPILEGRILAENLSSPKIKTTLITEAQIYNAVQNVDCGIIGADKVLKNGKVINKVGSNLLALACKEFCKPFYVIADKTKFSKNNLIDNNEKPSKEIYSGTENKIKINNYYFEEIPNEYITKIITD
ncbi:MAG: hypothetical protein QY331_09595 [Melioribacteraceae bacterium]|nr:MAG: hypothetical protein QY331_09595 [Melioribacteraceae bacterium]